MIWACPAWITDQNGDKKWLRADGPYGVQTGARLAAAKALVGYRGNAPASGPQAKETRAFCGISDSAETARPAAKERIEEPNCSMLQGSAPHSAKQLTVLPKRESLATIFQEVMCVEKAE